MVYRQLRPDLHADDRIIPKWILEQGAEDHINSNRDEVTGSWRKLHNEELHTLYSGMIRVNDSSRMRWERQAARIREKRNAYTTLVGKPEGEEPL
jgi:hypothetical protein